MTWRLPGPLEVLWTACKRWAEVDTSRLAAAIAFHAVLSLGPLLLLLIYAGGRVLSEEAARARVLAIAERLGGPAAVPVARSLVGTMAGAGAGAVATVVGAVILLYSASAVFRQSRDALNHVWGVVPKPGLHLVAYRRLLALVVVLAVVVAFLLLILASLLANILGPLAREVIPKDLGFWRLVNAGVTLALLSLLLALVFKLGPEAKIPFRDVWIGAILTAVLLDGGNFLIGRLLGRSVLVSLYGAAGVLIVVLLWAYYGALILLFGAQFTRAYAERYGSRRELGQAPGQDSGASPTRGAGSGG